jgi:hypothetical protein
MADPVTVGIGVLVASALGMAGEAALKGAVGEAVKDVWKALKGKVAAWTGSDLEQLEKTPTSAARQAVVAEAIENRPADEKDEALSLARQLIAALKQPGGAPVGLDIGRLTALEVQLGEISVTEGTGARIDEVRAGTFKVGPIKAGGGAGKA